MHSFFKKILYSLKYIVVGKVIHVSCNFKGEVSREFDVISKRKNVCRSTVTQKSYCESFVINYHPCAIELSISASGQRQSRLEWIET